jgi:DNA-binding CsgD family transcriptional regulator/tetratricopeptide (TPR) repeat protein
MSAHAHPGDAYRPSFSQTPFVGRERELSLLRQAHFAMMHGSAQFVLLAGEPGIGKTRLIDEFLQSLDPTTSRILMAHCIDWQGSPAYWPWTGLFRDLLAYIGEPALLEYSGENRDRFAMLLPEIGSGVQSSDPSLHPERARFEQFEAVRRVLTSAAADQSLVVVMDDIHWADAPSLALLRYLSETVRTARMLIIAAFRRFNVERDSPLEHTLAAITRHPGHLRMNLGPLTPDAVRSFIQMTAANDLERRLLDKAVQPAEGNPFFMKELTRLHADQHLAGGDSVPVPDSVREVIRQRLQRLSAPCFSQLSIASVIGREFALPLLVQVSDEPVERVISSLDEAERAGLIEGISPDADSYRFAHALIQDSLYGDIPGPDRLRIHRRVGEAIEASASGNPQPLFATLARHFGHAAPIGTAEHAVSYALKAAEIARSAYAWETEIEHIHQALRAADWLDQPDPIRRCEMLLGLGDAQSHAGKGRESAILISEAPEASQTFLEAAAIARSITDPAYLARAVIGFTGPDLGVPHSGQHGLHLIDEALLALPETDSEVRARLLARSAADTARLWGIGALNVDASAFDEIHQRSNDAVAMARRLHHPTLLAYTLEARFQMRDGLGLCDPDDPDTEEMLQLAMTTGDAEIDEWGQTQRYASALQRGEIAAADRALDQLEEVQTRRRTPRFDQRLIQFRTGQTLRRGQLDAAERLLDETLSLWPQSAVTNYQRATLRWEQGRIDEAMKLIETRVHTFPRHPLARSVRITLWLERGDVARAKSELHAMTADDFADVPRGLFWASALCWLAQGVYLLDEPEFAGRLYELLFPYRDRNLFGIISDHSGGSVYHYLGLLATTMKRWKLAEQHFKNALERNTRWEIWPYAAHSRYAWAEMLERRKEPADIPQAIKMNQEALDAATQMGMHRLARMSRNLQERLNQAMEKSTVRTQDGLSSREIEVLRLIADGMSDRAIAERLFISPRTVGSHVSNILTKLNVTTRAEAAVVAVRRAIV